MLFPYYFTLPPFQIVTRLIFYSNFDHVIILFNKFGKNIIFYVMNYFINKSFFKNNLSLIMFAQLFWKIQLVKLKLKKAEKVLVSPSCYLLNWIDTTYSYMKGTQR